MDSTSLFILGMGSVCLIFVGFINYLEHLERRSKKPPKSDEQDCG